MSEPQIPQGASLARTPMPALVAELAPEAGLRAQLLSILHLDAAAANRAVLTMSSCALSLLPVGTLSPVEKATYGRVNCAYAFNQCRNVGDAITMLAPLGIQLGLAAERLTALPRLHSVYTSMAVFGTQVINLGMDYRALLAPVQAELLDAALTHVQARLKDPALSRQERDTLLDHFSPALVELDKVLTQPAERKAEIKDVKLSLQQQLAEAQADAAYAETQLKLRQKLLVPREELLAAARRHQELKKKTPAPPPAGGPLPPPPGQRRIT